MSTRVVFLASFLAVISFSCMQQQGESLNSVLYDSTRQEEILIGSCTPEGLKQSSLFKRHYNASTEEYGAFLDTLSGFSNSLEGVEIKAFFGSWCPDSQWNLPCFIEMLEDLNFSMDNLKIYAVDGKKLIPNVDVSGYGIDYVPTFIIYKDGVEIGRIVENPNESLEVDFYKIVSAN